MKILPALQNKKILLGVTGSIAAYKSAELVRMLKKAGADVRIVMSQAATAFITPMTLQALSGFPVHQHLLNETDEAAMSHITLARWPDLILIAPATAHFLAKLTGGLADDLLSTLCLATTAPLILVPAMNKHMWSHPATQHNVQQLRQRAALVYEPAYGEQACGEVGEGRMLEPENILIKISEFLEKFQKLKNFHILITAGPTQEAIDPVRYLSNHSSGKMGYAIAVAAAAEGAKVTLISGPTALACPSGIQRLNVVNAVQMYETVMAHVSQVDVLIATAAVADYRPKKIYQQKIKKSADTLTLELERNPDILTAVSQLQKRPYLIGFAAETENVVAEARKKLQTKKLDMIMANEVGEGKGFQSDYNELIAITLDGQELLSFSSKKELAEKIINLLSLQLEKHKWRVMI